MQEITLAKIGSWFWSAAPVIAGSCYAFISNNNEMTKVKSWATFLIGTFIAFTISKGIIEYTNIPPLSYYAYSIQIICGLFLIQTVQEAFKQIPKVLDAARVKWFGG